MKKIKVSFDVNVTGNHSMTDDDLKKDVSRMLNVYARSNGLCVDNITLEAVTEEPRVDHYCRGFGCALSRSCLRHLEWLNPKGWRPYFDHCDEEKRDGYISNS